MNAYAQHNVGFYSRRTMSFFLVAGAHAAVFAALMWTISTTTVNLPTPPFDAKIIDQERPRDRAPKVPTPPNKLTIDVREPQFKLPPIGMDLTDPLVGDPQPMPPGTVQTSQPPAHVAKLQQGGAGPGFPDPAGFYPEQEIRLGGQGVSEVQVCVNVRGRLTADPVTSRSSGLPRLDAAALKLAKAGSGHYRPSTEDGVPVDACYPIGVRFQLKN